MKTRMAGWMVTMAVTAALAWLWGCGTLNTDQPAATGVIRVTVVWPQQAEGPSGRALPPETDSIDIKVYAADMREPVTTTLSRASISGGTGTGTLTVPAGTARTVKAVALAGGWPMAAGISAPLDVVANQTTNASVTTVRPWSFLVVTPLPVRDAAFAVSGGKIYIMGGRDYVSYARVGTVNIFDTATNTWSTGALMPEARADGVAVTLSQAGADKIHVFAGTNDTVGDTDVVLTYDPTLNTWAANAVAVPPAVTKSGGEIVKLRGLYWGAWLFGAAGSETVHLYGQPNVFYKWDPATNAWTSTEPNVWWGVSWPKGVYYPSTGGRSPRELVFSGQAFDYTNLGNPVGLAGAPRGGYPMYGAFLPSTNTGTGSDKVYCSGGWDLRDIQAYFPQLDRWAVGVSIPPVTNNVLCGVGMIADKIYAATGDGVFVYDPTQDFMINTFPN